MKPITSLKIVRTFAILFNIGINYHLTFLYYTQIRIILLDCLETFGVFVSK